MFFPKSAALIGISAAVIFAAEITLQQGTGYTGCQDVTLYSDGKAENYSLYVNKQYAGKPTDNQLIATQFCC